MTRLELVALLAGSAAADAANLAHFSGVWMTWLAERVTVNGRSA